MAAAFYDRLVLQANLLLVIALLRRKKAFAMTAIQEEMFLGETDIRKAQRARAIPFSRTRAPIS